MPTFRKERIAESIREVLSNKLIKESSLIPNGLVTISKVEVAKDYSIAIISYTVFGDNLDEKVISNIMKKFEPECRYEVSQKLNMRKTPRIKFEFDKNIQYAALVDSLLNKSK